MTEKQFHVRYRIPSEEILRNRRAYHYLHEYVMSRNPEILRRAYREIGRKGIVQIARWLGQNPDILIAIARRQSVIKGREAM